MKIAYLDCASGISGDMTLGALLDAGVELDALNQAIGSLGLGDCRLSVEEVRRCGFRATRAVVEMGPQKAHRHLPKILEILRQSNLTQRQQATAERIFTRLAEAEAHVHGTTIDQVHFHELGAVDTIVDVVGAVVGFDLLGVERIVVSPIPTGSGMIQIAHGRVSVPAPATAELLRGVPLAASTVEAELTTPTGAVLITSLADEFGPMPAMRVDRIGCGAGGRELAEQPNLLRLLLGESAETLSTDATLSGVKSDQVWLLETNLDNTTGELIGHCLERLLAAGALDAWTTPIMMKKNRPGVLLSVLCQTEAFDAIERILFEETPTLGIRRRALDRHVLRREPHEVTTPWGPVQGKIRFLPDGSGRFSPEYESSRTVAEREGVALQEVWLAALAAWDRE